jgi:hypothetical protein
VRARCAISLFVLAAVLCGCQTTVLTPKEAFFRRHPELRSRYVTFAETSFEVIDDAREHSYRSRERMAEILREDFSKYPDLVERLDGIRKRLTTGRDGERDYWRDAKKQFNARTDALFYYDYREPDGAQEQGWVIIRGGEIHRKFWAASSLDKREEKP